MLIERNLNRALRVFINHYRGKLKESYDYKNAQHGECQGQFCGDPQGQSQGGANSGQAGRFQIWLIGEFSQHRTDKGAQQNAWNPEKNPDNRSQCGSDDCTAGGAETFGSKSAG